MSWRTWTKYTAGAEPELWVRGGFCKVSEDIGDKRVFCRLCPRYCVIAPGETGFCQVRKNFDGELRTRTYGRMAAVANDPIEKKPLYGFLPHTRTLSIGSYGCNLDCMWCQNYELSRSDVMNDHVPFLAPAHLVEVAKREKCASIAFTYNEPTVFAEYLIDAAEEAQVAGLKRVLVSNGYTSSEAAKEIYPLIDAANIDLKGASDRFYRENTAGSIQPVLNNILRLLELNKHVELTTLVIPGFNDAPEDINELIAWGKKHLSNEVIWHFTAYYPCRNCMSPPTSRQRLAEIVTEARNAGLNAV